MSEKSTDEEQVADTKEEDIDNPLRLLSLIVQLSEDVGSLKTNVEWLKKFTMKLDNRIWIIVTGIILVILLQFLFGLR